MSANTLSAKAVCILSMIAEGHRYEQILDHYPDLTYFDIFDAASEAVSKGCQPTAATAVTSTWDTRMSEIKELHPRAYAKWEDTEDDTLRTMFAAKASVKDMARALKRQPGAIRSRLLRNGLVEP